MNLLYMIEGLLLVHGKTIFHFHLVLTSNMRLVDRILNLHMMRAPLTHEENAFYVFGRKFLIKLTILPVNLFTITQPLANVKTIYTKKKRGWRHFHYKFWAG
jgi:hypothetical protein